MAKKNIYAEKMRQARKKGIDPLTMLYIKEQAKKHADAMEEVAAREGAEIAFKAMCLIPLNVMYSVFWPKKAKMKKKGTGKTYAKIYLEEVLSLFDSWINGSVEQEDLEAVVYELTGMTVETEWDQRKEEG